MKTLDLPAVKSLARIFQAYLEHTGQKLAIAFSGGVDSTLLLAVAIAVLGKERVLAITAKSPLVPVRDLRELEQYVQQAGVQHLYYDFDPFALAEFVQNDKERCYYCKLALYTQLQRIAEANNAVLCEGSNVDDMSDYRPGLRALRELGIKSPLCEAGLTKAQIRELSREFGLPTWNKPSFACLASRFPYGEIITQAGIVAVDRAEQFLFELGLTQFRVRVHGNLARVEVLPEQFDLVLAKCEVINNKFKEYGFAYVALDLVGYRTGSLNEVLQ